MQYLKFVIYIEVLTCIGMSLFWFLANNETRKLISRPAIAVALISPAAGFFLPSFWLFCAFLAALPLLANSREHLAGIYLVASFLTPAIGMPINIGSLYLVPFDTRAALGFGCLLAIALLSLRGRRGNIVMDIPFYLIFIIFLIINARDTTFTNSLRGLSIAVLACALPYFILSRSAKTIGQLSTILAHFIFAGVILSVLLTFEAVRNWPIYIGMVDNLNAGEFILVKLRAGFLRASGPSLEPTSMAFVMSLMVVAAWASRSFFRSRLHRWAAVLILMLGTLAPQSRGAMLGALIGIACVEIYRRRYALALGMPALCGIAFFMILLIALPSQELAGYFTGATSGGVKDYRLDLFSRGVEEFWKNPIFGAPPAVVAGALIDLKQGEGLVDFVNTYLSTALFSGAVGLIFFIVALLMPVALVFSSRRRAERNVVTRDIGAFLFGSGISIAVMYFFTSFMGPQFYVTLFVFGIAAAFIPLLRSPEFSLRRHEPDFDPDAPESSSPVTT